MTIMLLTMMTMTMTKIKDDVDEYAGKDEDDGRTEGLRHALVRTLSRSPILTNLSELWTNFIP